ncbi:EamA family transporter [Oleiharenicola lentus]|uniref:EamA family transporter n=1 Tax=Oleiharenicola lentus TaxID=2508720 RepID=UPI003F674405
MWLLLIVSVLWAFSFGLIKRYLVGVDSSFVSAVRLGLALLVFIPFLRFRGVTFPLALKLIALGAVQFGLMYLAYNASFQYLHAYEVALFTLTTPIFVTLLADLLDRNFHARSLFAALLAVIATGVLVYRHQIPNATWQGLALVQASNLAFAFGQVGYRRLRAQHTSLRDRDIFAWLYLGAFVTALIAILLSAEIDLTLKMPQLLTLVYLGLVASGLGFFLWNLGALKVSGGKLAVMNNLKIPLAVACALLVFGESANVPRLLTSLALFSAALWLTNTDKTSAKPR